MNEILGSAFGAIILFGILALYFWSIFYSYRDAKARGKSGVLIALLVAFIAWPLGFLIWVIARPRVT